MKKAQDILLAIAGIGLVVLVVVLVTPGITASHTPVSSAVSTNPSEPEETVEAAPPAEPEVSPAQQRDHVAQSEGFRIIESGHLYARFAEKGTYNCGSYRCTVVEVYAHDGCPSALYVEGNVMSSGAALYMTNGTTSGISPGGSARVMLEDYRDAGDSFELQKVECY